MPTNDSRFGGRRSTLLTTSSARVPSVLERQASGYRYRLNWRGKTADVRRRKAVSKKGTVYVKRSQLRFATTASFILIGAATLAALPPGARAGTDTGAAGKALTSGTISATGTVTDGGANKGVSVTPANPDTVTDTSGVIANTTNFAPFAALDIESGGGGITTLITGTGSLKATNGGYSVLVTTQSGNAVLTSSGTTTFDGTAGIYVGSSSGGASVTTSSTDQIIDTSGAGGTQTAITAYGTGAAGSITNAATINSAAFQNVLNAIGSSASVINTGAIKAFTNVGINAQGSNGDVTVTTSGSGTVDGSGLYAIIADAAGSGLVHVTVGAAIGGTTQPGDGVWAMTESGDTAGITVDANANISASSIGILATSAGGAVTINVGNGATVSGGSGGIEIDGHSGTVVLTGTGSVSGGITFNGASGGDTLSLATTSTLTGGATALGTNNTIKFTGAGASFGGAPSGLSGFDHFEDGATGTLTLASGDFSADAIKIDGATLKVQGGTYSHVLSGSGTLEIGGDSTLSGTNTFTGSITVDAGDTLSANAASVNTASGILLNGSATAAGFKGLTAAGNYTVGFQVKGDPTFDTSAGDYTISGAITDGGGAGDVVVIGGNTLTLDSGANTFSGGIVVKAGSKLAVDVAGDLGSPTGAGLTATGNAADITLGDGATTGELDILSTGSAFSSSQTFFVSAGGGKIGTANTHGTTLSGTIKGSGTLTTGGGPETFTGALTNAGLEVDGSSIVIGDGLGAGSFDNTKLAGTNDGVRLEGASSVTLKAGSTITASGAGISGDTAGGTATVDVSGTVTGGSDGLNLTNTGGTASVTVESGGKITGIGSGVVITSSGASGGTTVTNSGTISDALSYGDHQTGTGKQAFDAKAGSVTTGDVGVSLDSSDNDAVFTAVDKAGAGNQTTVTGTNGDAISVKADTTGTATVDASGLVNSNSTISSTGGDAIYAESDGGAVVVKTGAGAVTGDATIASYGIYATADTSVDVTTHAGTVSGGATGVAAITASATDNITITTGGAVTGATGGGGFGIYANASNAAATGLISITAGGNVSGDVGIRAATSGSIAVADTGAFTIAGHNGRGIFLNSTGAGDVSVGSTDGKTRLLSDVTGDGDNAIDASSSSGNVEVYTAGSITALNAGAGISAGTSGAGVKLIVDTTGTVTGVGSAISTGAGASAITTIQATNTLTSSGGDAIHATTVNGLLTIGTGSGISGAINATGGDGINATSTGSGAIAITTDTTGTIGSTADNGVTAVSTGTGTGAITVDLSGAIGGFPVLPDFVQGQGVHAEIQNSADTHLLSVTTGVVASTSAVVYAVSAGSGGVSVTTDGQVSTASGAAYGIVAQDDNASHGDVTVTINDRVGFADTGPDPADYADTAIYAQATNAGSDGKVTVHLNGDKLGAFDVGVDAKAASSGNVLVDTADGLDLTAGNKGILARANTGTASVTLGKSVTIDPAISAIDVESVTNDATATLADGDTLTVASAGGSGVAGIIAKSGGTASIVGSTNDLISVTDDGGAQPGVTGIEAIGTGTNSSASIIGFVTGDSISVLNETTAKDGKGNTGVKADATGSGTSTIHLGGATVSVAGADSTGIEASTTGAAGPGGIDISDTGTITVTGSANGVSSGTSYGVKATGASSTGIKIALGGAVNVSNDLTGGATPGGTIGVYAHTGSGGISVSGTSAADITTSGGAGIDLANAGLGLVSIGASGANKEFAGDVSAANGDAIDAASTGGGDVKVYLSGVITANTDGKTGVKANASGGDGNVVVDQTTSTITSHGVGVHASAAGSGTIAIDTQGVTSGTGTVVTDGTAIEAVGAAGNITAGAGGAVDGGLDAGVELVARAADGGGAGHRHIAGIGILGLVEAAADPGRVGDDPSAARA